MGEWHSSFGDIMASAGLGIDVGENHRLRVGNWSVGLPGFRMWG